MATLEEPSLPALSTSSVLSFLGIRKKDLPYGGSPKSTALSKPPLFASKGLDDDEGSRLLSSLTGTAFAGDCVANAAVKKSRQNRAHFKDARAQQETDLCTGCFAYEEVGHFKDEQIFVPDPVKECPRHFEKALDTTDLSFWMYTVVPDGAGKQDEESYSDADSEELERRAAIEKVPEKVVTAAADDHGLVDERAKREEFRARVKESMSFVRMRTEMLQDLSLGEASKDESPILPGGGDTSFMSSSSVLLKHARKLAGLLHTEEQALSLQDLYQWFQNIDTWDLCALLVDLSLLYFSSMLAHLFRSLLDHPPSEHLHWGPGKTLGEDALGASPKSTLHNQLEKLRSVHVAKDLFKSTEEAKPPPTPSPHELLKQVEHDVRDRLANLYQGKNFIMSHQADVWANLESSNDKEAMLHATMERLQNMEASYEILGTTILQSLKEAERMEEEFHVLQAELVSNGCPLMTINHRKSKKSSHKGKKKAASTDSDGINSGSSRSESSSAQSSSRHTNSQAEETKVAPEQPSNNSASDGKIESKSASKTKKKKTSQKTEKKKGEQAEDGNDGVNAENKKRLKSTSEEASVPVQALSPSLLSSVPPLSVVKEEKGGVPDSVKGPNNVLNEGSVSNASPAIEGVQMQEGAKATSSDVKGQLVDGTPIFSEPSRSSKGANVFASVESKLILPKVSLNVLEVKPSDSASVQILPKAKRKSRRLSSEVSKDETVQTDDVAILSLEDCDVEALQARDYQAADVKGLLEKMKKLQKQLQFWRTKNWAEKHTGQGHMMPLPTYNQFIKVDALPDMGMLCYYNSRTGVHVMKNVADLDASMQQSIIELVDGPSESPEAPQTDK